MAQPPRAWAHSGLPPTPHDIAAAWSWDPTVLAALTVVAWLYTRGLVALWRRVGVGRGVGYWQAAAFASGIGALFLALVSPLAALGSALFAAHMVQHLLLLVVAAPLLVLGAPLAPLVWALPEVWRHEITPARWRAARLCRGLQPLRHPVVASAVQAGTMWLWHLPPLYQAALNGEAVHALEHASFLGTAVLFWWALGHAAFGWEASYGARIVCVFATALQSGALGALITFAPAPWYPAYAATAPAWGLTPLEDQQLAGLVMWVPANLAYLVAAAVLFASALHAADLRARWSDD